jgi:hypothetical protein
LSPSALTLRQRIQFDHIQQLQRLQQYHLWQLHHLQQLSSSSDNI